MERTQRQSARFNPYPNPAGNIFHAMVGGVVGLGRSAVEAGRSAVEVGCTAAGVGLDVLQAIPDLAAHGERLTHIVRSARAVWAEHQRTQDMASVAQKLREEIMGLGGVVRKAAQQLGTRPDVVPAEEIREALTCLLEDNTPRGHDAVKRQMDGSFPLRGLHLNGILKTGTIGEVSKVSSGAAGNHYALKTISTDQRALYEEDFEIFRGPLLPALSGLFAAMERVHPGAKAVRPVIRKVVDLARDRLFQQQIMDEFDLRKEARNMQEAATVLSEAARVLRRDREHFAVPEVIAVAGQGEAMLMEFVPGLSLTSYFPQGAGRSRERVEVVVADLLGLFLHGLVKGPMLHADLHPGNILLDDERMVLVDWGSVLSVPAEHRKLVRELITHIHGGQLHGQRLMDAFVSLGVTLNPSHDHAGEDQYLALAKYFDLVAGARRQLDAPLILDKTQCFELPDWIKMWQKATNAFVTTLVCLNAPESVERHLPQILQLLE